MEFRPGRVELKTGEMQDKAFRKWLVDETDVAFVNNFGSSTLCGSFSGARDGSPSLDEHVAALFAMMKEGAVLVTVAPLLAAMGCLSRSTANKKRRELGLPESDNASFYEYDQHHVGKQCDIVHWSQGTLLEYASGYRILFRSSTWLTLLGMHAGSGCDKAVNVCRYTRTIQKTDKAVYLCNNPDCEKAQKAMPIPVVYFDDAGAPRVRACDCRFSDKQIRKRKRPEYFSAGR